MPARIPAPTGRSDRWTTSPITWLARAPSAIRMPISRVRWETTKLTTRMGTARPVLWREGNGHPHGGIGLHECERWRHDADDFVRLPIEADGLSATYMVDACQTPHSESGSGFGIRTAGRGTRDARRGTREAGSGKQEAGSGKRKAGSAKREAGSGKRGAESSPRLPDRMPVCLCTSISAATARSRSRHSSLRIGRPRVRHAAARTSPGSCPARAWSAWPRAATTGARCPPRRPAGLAGAAAPTSALLY
jgi:hypothetical protein